VSKRIKTFTIKEKGNNMAKVVGEVIIDVELCKGCELCITACPEHTLKLSEGINKKGYQYAEMSNENCTGCASCSLMCPDAVITVYRKTIK
jgi:2-oxoglutarate ferredoxin oxidoreductase subunit delta